MPAEIGRLEKLAAEADFIIIPIAPGGSNILAQPGCRLRAIDISR